MATIAIIPARCGSKGIRHKNLLKLGNKTLIQLAIEAASKCELIDEIIVSTDSDEYAKQAIKCGAKVPSLRPSELAHDNSTAMDVIGYVLNENKTFDRFVYLQPTSPFRRPQTIDDCLAKLDVHDECVTVARVPHNFHPDHVFELDEFGCMKEPQNINTHSLTRHSKGNIFFGRNGPTVYCARTQFISNNKMYSGNLATIELGKIESIDIDDEEDYLLANYLTNGGFFEK